MEFSDEAAHELQACDAAGVPAVGFALLSMASRSSAKIASFCTAGGHGRGRCRPARWRYGGPARRVARPIADNARRSPTAAAPARRRSSRLSDPPHRRRRRDKARRSMDPGRHGKTLAQPEKIPPIDRTRRCFARRAGVILGLFPRASKWEETVRGTIASEARSSSTSLARDSCGGVMRVLFAMRRAGRRDRCGRPSR